MDNAPWFSVVILLRLVRNLNNEENLFNENEVLNLIEINFESVHDRKIFYKLTSMYPKSVKLELNIY